MKLYKNYVVSTIIISFIAILLNSCESPTTEKNKPKGVTLDTTLDLVVGEKKTLTVTINPPGATNQKIVWSSSDATIATVDDSGEITALKVGQTIITVTTADGSKTASCTVTVKPVSTKQQLKNLIYQRMQATGYKGNANDPGTDIDLNDIDISQIKDLSYLFASSLFRGGNPYLDHFNGDISSWNVSNVTNMRGMFAKSQFNGNISNWTVGNVTDMNSMFSDSQFNQDISSWDVSEVTNMGFMFKLSQFNDNISGWDVSNVTNMEDMFSDSQFNQDISSWDVFNVTNMSYMFYGVANFDNGGKPDDLDSWRIAPNVNKDEMFYETKLETNNNLPCWLDGNLDNCPAIGVRLNKTTLSLVNGTEETLTAIFEPINTPNKQVSWKSSDTAIATVDQDGKVTTVSVGDTTIEVKTDDGGYTARCKVYVTASTVAVTKVSLDNATLSLDMGATETLTATIDPPSATNQKVDWSSSESTIATVYDSGEITALKAGTATITANTADGGKTASCTVTVNPVVISTKQQLKDIIYKIMQAAGYKGNAGDPGTDVDLNDIDISQLKELTSLFESKDGIDAEEPHLHHFNGDISGWDVSNVTNMYSMFYKSHFNGDISNWKVDNVTYMLSMFLGSHFNGDISNWKVDNVTNMGAMFAESQFNGDISNWKVDNVTNMGAMFAESQFNGDISNWKVANVTNMENMFAKSQFKGNISGWDVSNVENMGKMFTGSQFNGDISNWKVDKVTDMKWMFFWATKFDNGGKPDGLDGWRIAPSVNKVEMFYGTKLETDNNLPCWADGDLSNCQNP